MQKHVLADHTKALRITKQFISFNDKESNNALWISFLQPCWVCLSNPLLNEYQKAFPQSKSSYLSPSNAKVKTAINFTFTLLQKKMTQNLATMKALLLGLYYQILATTYFSGTISHIFIHHTFVTSKFLTLRLICSRRYG